MDDHTGGPDEQGRLRTHPRTAVTLSRVAQGVASFAFAAAGTAGFVTTVVTFVVASIICTVGALLVGEGHRILPTLRMGRVWAVAVVGFISMVLAATAYELASVAVVSFLLLLVPLFSGILAPLYGERMTRNGVIGLGISVLGIIAFAQPSQDYQAEPLGLVAALLGGLGLAILWMMSRGLATMNDGLWALSATQMIGPALLGLLVITVSGSLPAGVGMWWLIVAGIGYAGNTIWRLMGLRLLPASTAALLSPISALVSTAMGIVILNEIPDALTWFGATVITLGVIIATRPSPGR